MRPIIALLLTAAAAPALAAGKDCETSLERLEAASRKAQEALLVARAQERKPDLAPHMAKLNETLATAKRACDELAAGTLGDWDNAIQSHQNGADDGANAPKGLDRLDRTRRGY